MQPGRLGKVLEACALLHLAAECRWVRFELLRSRCAQGRLLTFCPMFFQGQAQTHDLSLKFSSG